MLKKLLEKLCIRKIKTIDDFNEIVEIATEKNIINSHLKNIIGGAIQTTNLRVRDVMVPKPKMTTIPSDASFDEFIKIIINSSHSRFPVVEQSGKVQGILLAKDVLNFMTSDVENFNYIDYLRQAIIIPENKTLDSLLKFFQFKKSHMMIVVDEYSEVSGLITLEDVLEQIVGEIEDESDFEEDEITDYGNNRFLINSNTNIEDFNAYFDTDFNGENIETISGLISQEFGYLPKQLEEIKIKDFSFKILKTDSRKIILIEAIRDE